MFPLPNKAPHNLALIGHVVSVRKMFENNGHIHIHIYSPGAGAKQPYRVFFFLKTIDLLLIWSFAPRFSQLITLEQFSNSNVQATKFDCL